METTRPIVDMAEMGEGSNLTRRFLDVADAAWTRGA